MTSPQHRTLLLTIAGVTALASSLMPASARAANVKPFADEGSSSIVLPGEDWIAYESTSFRIALVRPDGTGDHALDNLTVGPEDNPDWSPDRRRLTFVGQGTDATSAPGLWIVDANGHGLRRIVDCTDPCQYLDDPAWSPDGRSIAYSRQAPNDLHGGILETADVTTGRTRTLLTADPGDFYAGVRWSPDGRSLVLEWVHASPTNYDDVTGVTLARVDIDGTTPTLTPLTDPALFAQTADWAPSGDYISFAAQATPETPTTDIYLIRPDGTGEVRLTELADFGGVHTDFTNDSSGVYFVDLTPDGPQLCLVDIATHAVNSVGTPVVHGFHPRTRPAR